MCLGALDVNWRSGQYKQSLGGLSAERRGLKAVRMCRGQERSGYTLTRATGATGGDVETLEQKFGGLFFELLRLVITIY